MTVHYQDAQIVIHHSDCLDALITLADNSIDAIVTDPPQNLAFMGHQWDTHRSAMEYQDWCCRWSTECLRALKPGGHLLAMGACRTWHRLACGIENAGFEIRDNLAWLYGQGWPKSRDTLKPAHEPIVLARKPFPGTVAANVAEHGTGRLNTEACRAGRVPANVLLDDYAAGELDTMTAGLKQGGNIAVGSKGAGPRANEVYGPDARDHGPWQSYGDSGGASRFFQVFRYEGKAPRSQRPKVNGVTHPTVKPLALCRWLVRLTCPPLGVVLDPFAGSGTVLEAALLERCNAVGIEREASYLPLITARLRSYPFTDLELGDVEQVRHHG